MKPHLWLIKFIGVIVPRRLRAGWRQEWEAELRYREALLAEWDKLDWRAKLALLWHSMGAFMDALWLQPKRLEDEMFQDLRFGLRMLRTDKVFTAVAALALGLGIGANTAIFSVVNAVLLRPLPFKAPQQLVWLEESSENTLVSGLVPGPHFLEWSERSRKLESLAGYNTWKATLTGVGEPEMLEFGNVTATFFPTLGAQFALGRNFLADEDRPGGERVAIISYRLWQRRFNSDPNVIGRAITLNDHSHTIVGVLQPDFLFIQPVDIWKPRALDVARERGNQMISHFHAIARLKPGVSREQAQTELADILQRYESSKSENMPSFAGNRLRVIPLHQRLVGDTKRLLLILFGAVGLVLLIACANVANLTMARAASRGSEMAIRAALGAGRLRLMRQMLTESLLLAAIGGLCGLLLAYWLTKAIASLISTRTLGEISNMTRIDIDSSVLFFTLLISLLTGVVFGLFPALQTSRPDLNASLKEAGRGAGVQGGRARQALMIAEVAMTVTLLIGAGLLVRSFINLLNISPGFRAENVLTARLSLPYTRYQKPEDRARFMRELLPRLQALPGVESAGATNHLPLTKFNFLLNLVEVEGRQRSAGNKDPGTPVALVTPDYFRAMGIPLLAGRYFTESDNDDARSVLILNEALARKLFPGEDAIGKRFRWPAYGKGPATVVGVVGDVRHNGLDQDVTPEIFAPYWQSQSDLVTLTIHAQVDPLSLIDAVRRQALAVDPNMPVYEVMTMEQRLSDSVSSRRFNLLLLGAFALLALTLAAVGVYGVISYAVTRRTHEIGVRMALGAQAPDVLRLFIKQGMSLVAAGMLIGLLGALALTRVMQSLLFGVSAIDPLTFALVASLLALIALAACYLPARRATKVDPMTALRHE